MPNVLACRVRHEHRTRLDTVTRSAPRPPLLGRLCSRSLRSGKLLRLGYVRGGHACCDLLSRSCRVFVISALSDCRIADGHCPAPFGSATGAFFIGSKWRLAIGGRGVVGLQ